MFSILMSLAVVAVAVLVAVTVASMLTAAGEVEGDE